jgi:hypothetical protein
VAKKANERKSQSVKSIDTAPSENSGKKVTRTSEKIVKSTSKTNKKKYKVEGCIGVGSSVKKVKGWRVIEPDGKYSRRFNSIEIRTSFNPADFRNLRKANFDAIQLKLRNPDGTDPEFEWEINGVTFTGTTIKLDAKLKWPPSNGGWTVGPVGPFIGDLEISLTWPYDDDTYNEPDSSNVQSIVIGDVEISYEQDTSNP